MVASWCPSTVPSAPHPSPVVGYDCTRNASTSSRIFFMVAPGSRGDGVALLDARVVARAVRVAGGPWLASRRAAVAGAVAALPAGTAAAGGVLAGVVGRVQAVRRRIALV